MENYETEKVTGEEQLPTAEPVCPPDPEPMCSPVMSLDDLDREPTPKAAPNPTYPPYWENSNMPPRPPMPPYGDPHRMPPPPKPPKRKGRAALWVLVFLLIGALIAEPFVLGMLREEPVSILRSAINDAGELIVYYTDGTSANLGTVVGKDGADGADGDGVSDIINITTTGDDTAAATAIGLRSAVSVWCTFVQESRRGTTYEYSSAGSGVIYQLDKAQGDAFVITNFHVVFDADSRTENGIAESIVLYLYGGEYAGKEIEATYVGGSQYYDIAVLRVEDSEILKDSDAIAVTVGDSDAVQVGSTAIAIGNPEASGISATVGVVSVDSEQITMTAADGVTSVDYRVMRVDTAVNSGNSGGGLYNARGELIGIVNAKTIDDGVENIGYALPSSSVIGVVENIIYYCYGTECESVMRSIMGVTVITADTSAVYDSENGTYEVVERVEIKSVTEGQIGEVFQVGDVLVSAQLNDTTKQITRNHHIIDLMLHARPGDTVVFTVLRDGAEMTLEITVTEDCLIAY